MEQHHGRPSVLGRVKCRARCDPNFGKGLSPILSHWTWYGQVLRRILPKYRPRDYALHGVTHLTHSGLHGCWRALVLYKNWAYDPNICAVSRGI